MGFSLNVGVPAMTVFFQGLLSFFLPVCCRFCLFIWDIYLEGPACGGRMGGFIISRKP